MKVKNLSFFSSYYRLNRSSLAQISDLLRLRKESYGNFLSEIALILQMSAEREVVISLQTVYRYNSLQFRRMSHFKSIA